MADPQHEQILRAEQGREEHDQSLQGLDLSGILATSLRLEGRSLIGANFQKASLNGGYFRDSDLSHVDLRLANLTLADLRSAQLNSTNMERAELSGAMLVGASLREANLRGAKLVKCRVEGADFTDADLAKADLRGVKGLTNEQLDSARNADQAILDEQTLRTLGRKSTLDTDVVRRGRKTSKRSPKDQSPSLPADTVEIKFSRPKPKFGDLYLICGAEHPDFPPQGGYSPLRGWAIEQTDDYFAWHQNGDPAIWIYPVVKGEVVHHHPGPFDAIHVHLALPEARGKWEKLSADLRKAFTPNG